MFGKARVRRHRKKVLVGLLLMGLLGLFWWLAVRTVPRSSALRLTFVCFTNGLAAERMALFNLSNSAPRSILYGTLIMIQTDGSDAPMFFPPDRRGYQRWAGNSPQAPPSTLVARTATTFATKLPEPGSVWIERVIWQAKPNELEDVYAAALDKVLIFFHSADYPPGLRPSARIWHEIMISSDTLHEQDAERGAALNGGPATPPSGPNGKGKGRHQ